MWQLLVKTCWYMVCIQWICCSQMPSAKVHQTVVIQTYMSSQTLFHIAICSSSIIWLLLHNSPHLFYLPTMLPAVIVHLSTISITHPLTHSHCAHFSVLWMAVSIPCSPFGLFWLSIGQVASHTVLFTTFPSVHQPVQSTISNWCWGVFQQIYTNITVTL